MRNGRMLEFRFAEFKVNVVSETNWYSLVMIQRHFLRDGRNWRRIARIGSLSTGSVERQCGQGLPRATTASENYFVSLSARRNREATTTDFDFW
ncbi:hypothetical protein TNCT_537941 [Trichonephila clavata]|uniref:Uncharacterized protein n=1 Tax=Trichonephila clavata TaxID=2740835 RepID=A0A8X6JDN4_TRICU|nr:hypothetical protein TNCT_537941 [Trichonephila clavata]